MVEDLVKENPEDRRLQLAHLQMGPILTQLVSREKGLVRGVACVDFGNVL